MQELIRVAIGFLLSVVAVIYFYRWWQSGNQRDGIIYAISASISGYFLLINLPFVLSPFLFALLWQTDNQQGMRFSSLWSSIKQLSVIGFLTAFLLTALLGPALVNDFAALSVKAGSSVPHLRTYSHTALFLGGAAGIVLTVFFFLIVCYGIWISIVKRNLFVLYLCFLAIMQVLSVQIASPLASDGFFVLSRYLLVLVFVLSVLFAVGLTGLVEIADKLVPGLPVKACSKTGSILFVALVTGFGPIPKTYYVPNNNTVLSLVNEFSLGDTIYDYINHIPDFYSDLAQQVPGSVKIVEVPFHYNFDYFFVYQRINRQHQAFGYVNGLCSGERLGEIPQRLREKIVLDNVYYLADGLRLKEQGLDYVVFHTDVPNEVTVSIKIDELDFSDCIEQYREWFGEPVFSDQSIQVFRIR